MMDLYIRVVNKYVFERETDNDDNDDSDDDGGSGGSGNDDDVDDACDNACNDDDGGDVRQTASDDWAVEMLVLWPCGTTDVFHTPPCGADCPKLFSASEYAHAGKPNDTFRLV